MTERTNDYGQNLKALHHAGELAYLDTFAGLIPCKVMSSDTTIGVLGEPHRCVVVKLTATRGAYQRGWLVSETRQDHVVPRSSVFTRSGQYMIRSDFKWWEES